MMGAAHDMPEIARLAAARVAVRDRLRWLSPNAKRARELLAEQRRMTLEELRLEVRPESQKARNKERLRGRGRAGSHQVVGPMRRRRVAIVVTDHAALRWLERVHGLDVAGLKAMLADKSRNGAELGATAVAIDGVRLVLEAHRDGGGRAVVTTVSPRHRGAKHPNRRGGDE